MFGMIRSAARSLLAALLLLAQSPLPLESRAGQGHDAPMACCGQKSCCTAMHACIEGRGCGGRGGSHPGQGPWWGAGACGDPAPEATPLGLDPTVAARVVTLTRETSIRPAHRAGDERCEPLGTQPQTPPPRA